MGPGPQRRFGPRSPDFCRISAPVVLRGTGPQFALVRFGLGENLRHAKHDPSRSASGLDAAGR